MRSSDKNVLNNLNRKGASSATGVPTERAFLVGIDYRQRASKNSDDAKAEPRPKLLHARAARAAAETVSADDQRISFGAEESLAELRELTESAGAQLVGEVMQRRDRPDPATLVGKGKVEEIVGAAAMANADVVIFDHD